MKLTTLCNDWLNQRRMNLFFIKSSHQRDWCLASIKRIKPFNGKFGQRDSTKISGSCPMLYGELRSEVDPNYKLYFDKALSYKLRLISFNKQPHNHTYRTLLTDA